jgi:hypothetical protein
MKNAVCVVIPPEAQVALVLRAMAEGKTVKRMREEGLLAEDDNPYLWAEMDHSIALQIERVKRVAAAMMVDQIGDIVDDASLMVAERKLKVEANQWRAEKFHPERFGSKAAGMSVNELDHMSEEQLEAKRLELMEKLKKELDKQEKKAGKMVTVEGSHE